MLSTFDFTSNMHPCQIISTTCVANLSQKQLKIHKVQLQPNTCVVLVYTRIARKKNCNIKINLAAHQ